MMIVRMSASFLCLWLLVCFVVASSSTSSSSTSSSSSSTTDVQRQRRLEEDANNNNNAYNNNADLSQYTITQGHCFRMKIVGDNDDDGNSYFYNGAYRAQYKRYISYQMCSSSSSSCHVYVSGLEEYLEQTVDYAQSWCSACAASCRRRNRQLDEQNAADADAAATVTANCKTCASECKLLSSNKGNSGTDESGYLSCQAAADNGNNNNAEAEENMQYYTAPQCENDHVVIGHFYDEECTIKTTTLQDGGFSYNTFQTIEGMKMDCSAGSAACTNLYASSVSCDDGSNSGGGDDEQQQDTASLCKAAAAAGRVYTYYKKPFYKKVPIGLIFFLLFGMGLGFGFLSYTYYVRHRRSKAVVPMANLDGKLDGSDLPEMS